MIEADLKVLGFETGDDDTLCAPGTSLVTLKRLGSFYRLCIDLGNGASVAVVVAKRTASRCSTSCFEANASPSDFPANAGLSCRAGYRVEGSQPGDNPHELIISPPRGS